MGQNPTATRIVIMPLSRKQAAKRLRRVATALFINAEDEDDDLLAILVLRYASRKKQILRGPYNGVQSKDFFELLMNSYTSREFKSFVR